jgi:cysteine-rich repeat protein
MREEHRILFPAFLVIFASFLAFNIDDLSSPSVADVVSSLGPGSVTGMVVEESVAGACGDKDVVGLFLKNNSHISMIGSGESVDYCAELSFSLRVDGPTRSCYADNSNLIAYISNGLSISSTFYEPNGIETVVDTNSFTTAYVTDAMSHCIREIGGNGLAEHFSGTCGTSGTTPGGATTAKFNYPAGLVLVRDVLVGDYFYVADRDNHCIRRVFLNDGSVSGAFAGACGTSGTSDGISGAARFNQPTGITVGPSGNLIVADTGNHCIRQVGLADGAVTTIAGTCGVEGDLAGVIGPEAKFSNPTGVSYNPSENLVYIADKDNNRIKSLDMVSFGVSYYAGGVGGSVYGAGFTAPYALTYDIASDSLYVADTNNQKIKKIDVAGSTISDFAGDGTTGFVDGPLLSAKFSHVRGVDLDAFGNLFIADSWNDAIRVANGNDVSTLAGNGTEGHATGTLIGGGHIYAPESTDSELPPKGYYQKVCYDKVQCDTVAGSSDCGAKECLLSFGDGNGGNYNVHAADCSYFSNKLCCEYLEPGSVGECGDGVQEGAEECDDGNNINGDGCDEFCKIEPFVDTDGDGIEDALDNCAITPNYGSFGTCIDVNTLSNPEGNVSTYACVDDADCAGKSVNVNGVDYDVEHCENSQDNEDGSTGSTTGDPCGNACDIDSNDRNTCLETGDQGGGGSSECTLALQGASFKWSTLTAERGDNVVLTLDLDGDDRCNNLVFDVDVINEDTQELSVVKPSPITVSGTSGTTNWTSENNNPGPDPDDARWRAKGYNFGGGIAPPSDLLTVTATDSYCGDSNIDPGEQCDDGNTVSGDGCTDTCLFEGMSGSGSGDGCSSYCVRGTAVCTSVGVAFCGDYDGNGCNELSNEVQCASGESCNPDFGTCVADICDVKNYPDVVEPSCSSLGGGYAWVCGAWTDCENGERTRNCNSCITGVCSVDPLERVDCSLEPSVKGPVFGMFSWVLAILALMLFYMFRSGKLEVEIVKT